MSKKSEGSRNSTVRPKKGGGPRLPYEEIDRLLVFGEVVPCNDEMDTILQTSPRCAPVVVCITEPPRP